MPSNANLLRIHVHDDTRVLDGTLRLGELAAAPRPIGDTLLAMCQLVADVAPADVVSVYLRERRGEREVLVMRANVGFPADAIGRVQLGLDEGLTGVVAARRRPVTVAVAQEDDRYKHVDGIGEEQFAAYLGVPLIVGDRVAGVLVMQRRAPGTFDDDDVALALSLTMPFTLVIGRGDASARAACLVGTAIVPGRAVGATLVLPPPTATPTSAAAALHALEFDLVVAAQRLGHGGPRVTRSLDNLGLVMVALRDYVASDRHDDVIAALERVPYHASAGAKNLAAVVDERQREVDDLWSFLASDMQHRLSIGGAVLVARRLGSFLALEAIARGAAAVVAERIDEGARDVLEAAQLPAIVIGDAAALSNGVLVEVDATLGTVRVR